jgi:hypothetical protein
MNPLTQNPKQTPGRFRVGDRVRHLYLWHGAEGEIVEDHGPIGVNGRRIYSVKMKMDEGNEPTLGVREDDLEAISQ